MESKPSSTSPSKSVDPLGVSGDVILGLSSMANQTIKLGGGLRQDGDSISMMKAGKLRFTKPNKYWFEKSHKREELGGTYRSLRYNDGRTICAQVGSLLYVCVANANAGMNPELSCMDASGKAGEYGLLKDGYMLESSTGLSRMLLSSPRYHVLEALGKILSFEIAVGINGRFGKSESLSMVQQKIYLEKLLKSIQ